MNGIMSGTGTELDPYLVEDEMDLNEAVRVKGKTAGVYYKQTNNIDLMSILDIDYWCTGFSPLIMNGNYDGCGYSIYNLAQTIKIGTNTGLFSNIGSTGYVCNIKLINVKIETITKSYGENVFCGGLVGHIKSGGIVNNCTVTGSIKCSRGNITINGGNLQVSSNYIGGVVGYSQSDIDKLEFKGCIEGYGGYVGGIVGFTNNRLISNCRSNCNIKVYKYIDTKSGGLATGGIAGVCSNTDYCTIEKCISSVTIVGESDTSGGIAGACAYIYKCATYVNMECNDVYGIYGGLCGFVYTEVYDCYAMGELVNSKSEFIGGLVGCNSIMYPGNIKIINSYAVVKSYIQLSDIILGSAIGHADVSVIYNGDIYILSDNLYNRETEDKMKVKETYTGYNTCTKVTNKPDDTSGIDGDIAYMDSQRYYANSTYYGDVEVYKDIVYTKVGGVWLEASVERLNIGIQNDYDIYTFINIDTDDGLISLLKLIDGVRYRVIYHYINNSGVVSFRKLHEIPEIDYSYLFIYRDNYRYINRLKPSTSFNFNSNSYYIIGNVWNNMNYDFEDVWGISPNMNYGYPYLLDLDYSDIFDGDILDYIRIQLPTGLVTIPVYKDTNGELVVCTPKGIGNLKLVETTDSKASAVRVATKNGIKSISL